jgi:hypothetical protein
VALFKSLGYQYCADHLGGCGDVEQQGLLGWWWHHDRGRGEEGLQLLERQVRLVCPLELVRLFRSLKKGRPFSPSLLIKRPRAAIIPVSFMTSFFPVGRFILRMASTLVGFASMTRWLTMKPRSLPEGTPKMHFSGLSFQR